MGNQKCNLIGDKFVMEDYDRLPAFSSFLPGLAGVKGIPIWSFYTNRGQGINSFGIHNKANAMMEFNSAVTGYENAAVRGFRTFIRVNGAYFEPFCSYDPTAARRMEIEKNVVSVMEESHDLRITVRYMVLPHEDIGALVRSVTVENLGESKDLEILDGMPQIIVYGLTNSQYKEMSNLFKSWADIKNIEGKAPVYTMRASTDDSAEVSLIEGGYFYCAVLDGKLQDIIYDKNVIFDFDSSMRIPVTFMEQGLDAVRAKSQCFANKVPCAFVPVKKTLNAGESITFSAFAGFATSIELLNRKTPTFCETGYVEAKFADARALVDTFTKDIRTKTGDPLFDKYVEQCYLDNFLRGGYPFAIGKGEDKKIIHLFSRKHGDPERDYNFFSIAGEYYSQGNGNYRDVCQNRRNDVFFCPEVEDFNVRQFFNLVQMDGYNPLEIRPNTFVIPEDKKQEAMAALNAFLGENTAPVEKVISGNFTPGQITNAIAAYSLTVSGDEEELVEKLLTLSDQRQEAGFGEGYWSDHWDYDLDLVNNYLLVYPEKKQELLFGCDDYRYYDSVGAVRPRRDTYVLNKGNVRQYGAVDHSEEKLNRPGFNPHGTNWLKDVNGNEVTTTLFGKMLTLAVNKFALLDNQGLGIEMEGGKPGWNDAMNGLPGLFGSSMPEAMELKRLIDFMLTAVKEQKPDESIEICAELAAFMEDIVSSLEENLTPFAYWDQVANLREAFRQETKLYVSGSKTSVSFARLEQVLSAFAGKMHSALERALEIGGGIMPTYFTYEADDFEVVKNADGTDRISPYGLPSVKVHSFKRVDLPYFLEGPARMLSAVTEEDRTHAAEMCRRIKTTDIYDKKLKMYKTSASIEPLSMENGRVRAFTPGWLERESVFLHMEYKYFYGLLKAGLYDEFYEAIGDALIPYQDPAVYGRSILENSSFLASSANPDPAVHGQGFVGRLSGSTVEMLSMWMGMFLGNGGFVAEDGKLQLKLAPVLAGRMFDEQGDATFNLCGSCPVTYHNPSRKNTYGPGSPKVTRMVAHLADGDVEVTGDTFGEEVALAVRERNVISIDAWLEEKKEFPYGKAICYSGYRRGQSPREEIFPSEEEISQDLHILTDLGFDFVRMYDPNEHARRVLRVITRENLELKCMVGMDPIAEYNNPACAWATMYTDEQLEANARRNDAELQKLIALAKEYPDAIISVSVGNENRPGWGSDLVTEDRLVGWVNTLRANVSQLITYNEGAPEWPGIPEMAKTVDFISIHSYPVWNRVDCDKAVEFNKADFRKVQSLYPGKQVIFTECGWATACNDSMDRSQVGEAQQKAYISDLLAWTESEKIPVFLFEAFDEPWKGSANEEEPEKHWGIFNEDRSPKMAASVVRR